MVRLLYFAWLRERIGLDQEARALPAGVDRVDRLVAHLATLSPGHAAAFARPELVRCALNHQFASPDHAVAEGDEVAFFPPVTGG